MIDRRKLILAGAGALVGSRLVGPAHAAGGDLAWEAIYTGGDFTEQLRLFNKTPVSIVGFMAPPLVADAKF